LSILVPVDFSEVTNRVCDVAIGEAKARNAKVWLLHVAAPDPAFVGFDAGPDVVRDQVASALRSEHRDIQTLAERFVTAGVEVSPLLIQGETIETIIDQARRHKADLIVMATHGRGLMYQMFVGSVSEGVIHRTEVPVLLVPAR
jgi:nucleotide-binding universal stress UspA family protein